MLYTNLCVIGCVCLQLCVLCLCSQCVTYGSADKDKNKYVIFFRQNVDSRKGFQQYILCHSANICYPKSNYDHLSDILASSAAAKVRENKGILVSKYFIGLCLATMAQSSLSHLVDTYIKNISSGRWISKITISFVHNTFGCTVEICFNVCKMYCFRDLVMTDRTVSNFMPSAQFSS